MFADLHLHSTFSDGTDTPLELCCLAVKSNVKVISITDHDSVGAPRELKNMTIPGDVRIIPGIEISTISNHRYLHILGYYIDIFDKRLDEFIARVSHEKTENTKVNFKNAVSNGVFKYDWNRVLELNPGQPRISGVHVVKAMQLDKYKIPGMGLWEMFHLYFRAEGREFVETETTGGRDAIDIIRQIGGVSVIAHPKSIGDDDIVRDLLRYGAQGLEVYHPAHSVEDIEKYRHMSGESGKYISGGSDWHGKNNGPEITRFGMIGLEHEDYEILKLSK